MAQFDADDWARLTPAERVRHCSRMAAEARRLSEQSTGDLRDIYFRLSLEWQELATELARLEPDPEDGPS